MIPSLSVDQAVPSLRRNDAPALSSPPIEAAIEQAGNEPLESDRHFDERSPDFACDPVDDAAADDGLADARTVAPPGTVREQIEGGRGEIVVGVHQPGAGDDPVPVRVGIVAERDVEPILQCNQPGHRMRRRAVHADPAVPVDRHEREGRIDLVVHDLDPQAVPLGDGVPEGEARAPERVDADAEPVPRTASMSTTRARSPTYAPT